MKKSDKKESHETLDNRSLNYKNIIHLPIHCSLRICDIAACIISGHDTKQQRLSSPTTSFTSSRNDTFAPTNIVNTPYKFK